jgi:DUF4097 and DUF4098 domain-containing protein YvlB
MTRKVGRVTLAAALIIAGAVILIDNLFHSQISWYVARLWPAIIILVGLEWLTASARGQRDGVKPAADAGAVVLLVIVAMIAASASSWDRSPFQRRVANDINVDVNIPDITFPNFSIGGVTVDSVQTAPLTVDAIQELSAATTSGDITVQEGNEAKVEMRVHAYGNTRADAERAAQEFVLRVEGGARTTLRVQRPTVGRGDASLVITLPRSAKLALNAEASSGSINVAGREGNVILASSSGSLRVDRVQGNVDLRTSSGSITVNDVNGSLSATASSGSIIVTGVTGDAKVGSTSGSVNLNEVGGKINAQASSGSVTVNTDTVGGDYDIGAVSGGVRLTVPASAGISVTARASSGQVNGPSWLTIGEGRNSGSGQQGDGKFKMNLHSTSGEIRITTR